MSGERRRPVRVEEPVVPPAGGAFALDGLAGESLVADRSPLAALLPVLLDPAAARRTLHWGRNYLWVTDWPGVGAVVVKQFRNEGLRARLRRRLGRSKAAASFAAARALRQAGLPTPEPLLWADAPPPAGPSYYVCRLVEGVEARYPLRALNAGTAQRDFPELPAEQLLAALAGLARRLHAAGFWHRDLSIGNLLLVRQPAAPGDGRGDAPVDLVAYLLDLNRCRRPGRVSLSRRLRDLARLALFRREHQEGLLAAYFGAPPPRHVFWLFQLYHRSFHGRHRLKNRLRAGRGETAGRRRGTAGSVLAGLRPRRPYPHLPPPVPGAGLAERIVWDHLSDQPHQHTGRAGKLLVRLGDAPAQLRGLAVAAAAAPRAARRYRELRAAMFERALPFAGVGVALRPHPADPEALLVAVAELGVEHLLLRLHPWEEQHQAEEELARALHARGHRLVFALPQRRELVRDPVRWRAAVARLGKAFAPYGEAFQVGQAINRSKWGVWSLREYATLVQVAAEELAGLGRRLVGPGVIDFEPQATAAALAWPGLGVRFDALASLLYVDRRGAPEARQLGCDALHKATLLRALAETARWCAPHHWVTEVNWPLREGPHAPAGRDVAVDEETAADYLVRYYLPLLGSGMVERVYWWQLVARGYGLAVAEEGGLRRRPAFHALAALQRVLAGATCHGPLQAPPGCHLWRFSASGGGELLVAWSSAGPREVELPWPPARVLDRDGRDQAPPPARRLRLEGSPRYLVAG